MEMLWNWLMRANAKNLFIACLCALIAVVLWRGASAVRSGMSDAEANAAAEEGRKLDPIAPTGEEFRSFGILQYIDGQLRQDLHAVPVNLFRPSFESMVSNYVESIAGEGGSVDTVASIIDDEKSGMSDNDLKVKYGSSYDDYLRSQYGKGGRRPTWGGGNANPPPPPPRIVYNGLFKRTDGKIAAWVTETNSRQARFFNAEDKVFSATVERVDDDGIVLKLKDGSRRKLTMGEAYEFED